MPGLENEIDAPKHVDKDTGEVERLKRQTKAQLELLKKQTQRLELFKPDIDLVMQWYEIKSSHLSKFAHYYGKQSWYQRQVLHAEFVAGAVVLGFAVHALAFFALVAAYYKGTSLLADHYAVEESNKESMRQSLAKLGEGLEQSIKSFNEMETKLDRAFTAMEEQNDQLSSAIADLNQQAIKLHAQIMALEETVKQLQEQQKRIASTTDQIHDSGDRLGKDIESLSSLIIEKKSALDLVTTTIKSVINDSLRVEKESDHNRQSANELSREVTTQLELSEQQTKQCVLMEESICDSGTSKAVIASRDGRNRADKVMQTTHDLKERARRILAMSRSTVREKTDEPPEPSPTAPVF